MTTQEQLDGFVCQSANIIRLSTSRAVPGCFAGRVFRVHTTEEFSEDRCPLAEPFEGLSTNSEVVFAGEVRDARNSKEMRVALLCEMVCRAAKLLLRFYMRRSARLHGCVVPSIASPFAIDLLNALTGGHPTADVIWQEEIIPRVNQSYGDRAIDSVEACTVRTTLLPTLPYLIRRVGLCGLPINNKTPEALMQSRWLRVREADLNKAGIHLVLVRGRPASRP